MPAWNRAAVLLFACGLAWPVLGCEIGDCSTVSVPSLCFEIEPTSGGAVLSPDAIWVKHSGLSDYRRLGGDDCFSGQCCVRDSVGLHAYRVGIGGQTYSGSVRVEEDASGCHPKRRTVSIEPVDPVPCVPAGSWSSPDDDTICLAEDGGVAFGQGVSCVWGADADADWSGDIGCPDATSPSSEARFVCELDRETGDETLTVRMLTHPYTEWRYGRVAASCSAE